MPTSIDITKKDIANFIFINKKLLKHRMIPTALIALYMAKESFLNNLNNNDFTLYCYYRKYVLGCLRCILITFCDHFYFI